MTKIITNPTKSRINNNPYYSFGTAGKAIPTVYPENPSGLPYFLQLGILRGSVKH